jgi:aminoglycoside phosphotransferase (APT) family kinase protein
LSKDRETGSPITPDTAIRLLRELRLLDDADLVDGEVSVTVVRGRNANLRVESSGPRSWFLKQVVPGEDATPLATEAWFYARSLEPHAEVLRPHVPQLAHHDPARGLLVIELLRDARPADVLMDESSLAEMPSIGAALGSALAALHAAFPYSAARARPPERARTTASTSGGPGVARPWILDVHAPRPEMMRYLSPAQVTLIGLLQSRPHAIEALNRLRLDWAPSALIHGDVKWSNVLLAAARPAAWLIDWEFANWGDPAWDVGSALHSFLVDCIAHADATAHGPVGAATAFARALPRAQPEIRRFCDAYLSGRASGVPAADAFLARAVLFAAARLIQTAYESCERLEDVPRFAAGELQLALNLLARPEVAHNTLLGLPTPARRESE